MLVLDRLPQSLDKDVVAPATLAVRPNRNLMPLQHADEFAAGNGASNRRLTIGAEATIGAGACLIHDIDPSTTAVGVPATQKR
jgi:hypothetical protein